MKKTLKTNDKNKGKTNRLRSMKNLPTQWELKQKTDLQAGQATMSLLFCFECWYLPVDRAFGW